MLVTMCAFELVATGLETARPLLQGQLVASLTRGGATMLHDALIWLLAILAQIVLGAFASRQAARIEAGYSFAIRSRYVQQLYGRIVHLPWQWHGTQHSGTITSKVNDAAAAIYEFAYNQAFFTGVGLGLLGSLIALTALAPIVGITVSICAFLIPALFRHSDKKIVATQTENTKSEQFLSTGLVDYLGNIGTLIALRLQRASEAEIMRRIGLLKHTFDDSNRAHVNKSFWLAIVQGSFSLSVVLLYIVLHADENPATLVGAVVAILGYLTSIGARVHNLGWMQQSVLHCKSRLASVDDIQEAYRKFGSGDAVDRAPDWREATISGLHFHYEDKEHHIHQLADLSLALRRGRRVALVGASGSGKSTLLRLLRGLHMPAAGTLTLDGVVQPDFRALSAVSTLIPQDAEIFENTLRYNIAFGAEASDEILKPAIAMAALDDVIAPLPQKLDTDIRERGVNLSGGQKQRLALARGLFAAQDSSLLLMDEPTSSLDPITEAQVFANIFAGLPDTCIVAAIHRLHLLDRFDYVYVMEAGRVVEEGTLPDLLARKGVFARLWQAQKREELSPLPAAEG